MADPISIMLSFATIGLITAIIGVTAFLSYKIYKKCKRCRTSQVSGQQTVN